MKDLFFCEVNEAIKGAEEWYEFRACEGIRAYAKRYRAIALHITYPSLRIQNNERSPLT